MEINLIIRELLAKHNFISLPTLGSFIQKYEPARPSLVVDGFLAPKQSITFDSSRTFNDEAIENYLCEKDGISHADASKLLTEFVNKITEELNNGKDCVFENVGTLCKNKKGKIRFEQANDLDAALSTYGLKDIEVAKTTNAKTERIKTTTQVDTKPIPSKPEVKPTKKSSSLKIVVGIAVIFAITALAGIFILIPEFRFWEKYLNTNSSITESNKDSIKKVGNKLSQTPQSDTSSLKKDSLNTKVEQAISENNVKKTALYYAEPKIQDNKTFYLIVGSFERLENAQKLAEKYTKKGFITEIIQGSAMYRVSVNKFLDKNRALSEFNKFRNDHPGESIWVLGI